MHCQRAAHQRNQGAVGEQPATSARRLGWLDDNCRAIIVGRAILVAGLLMRLPVTLTIRLQTGAIIADAHADPTLVRRQRQTDGQMAVEVAAPPVTVRVA